MGARDNIGHFFGKGAPVTQQPAPSNDLDAIRRKLFGADMARIDRTTADLRKENQARSARGLTELRGRVTGIEKRKLNVADFGASPAALGRRFVSAGADETPRR